MRLSTVLGIKKTTTMTARFLTLGVIISGLLSLGFGVVTFYGLSTGTFVISMNEEATQKGIQMSTDKSFEKGTSRLYVDPEEQSNETTYDHIDIEGAVNANGLFTQKTEDYVAYSFYIRNVGFEMINLLYTVNINDVTLSLDEYIRIMIIVQRVDTDLPRTQTMYMKPDPVDSPIDKYPERMPEAKMFLSSNYQRDPIISESVDKFQVNSILKFTVFMWIEGYDTTPNMERGSIKIDMKFSIRNAA
ncbi:hypothetical protein N7603_05390 [Acholeplasma vituli]|uniref:Uncharacterized protein n=1 Tax=Paracholeplasma vituli TaxID=69473 RepID=A0ABT2PVV3_9MOLU|nr:hypothetical protein [Paracholeplasma vituli]MCU0105086.1 hypothetical protein [Paracholeplasma vituli]